jgi:hypothetical protein
VRVHLTIEAVERVSGDGTTAAAEEGDAGMASALATWAVLSWTAMLRQFLGLWLGSSIRRFLHSGLYFCSVCYSIINAAV